MRSDQSHRVQISRQSGQTDFRCSAHRHWRTIALGILFLHQTLVYGFVNPSASDQRIMNQRLLMKQQSANAKDEGVDNAAIPGKFSRTIFTASSTTAAIELSPIETWCVENLQEKYNQALSIKCPFFRRRAADLLDATDLIVRFLIIRHKSLPLEPPGWRCAGDTTPKQTNLPIDDLMEVIRKDWRPDTNKGYYITGRLSTQIYRDDCLFDGPDPDMPVRGLRKYLNAASQLFDHQKSRSELLSLRKGDAEGVVIAEWRMKGVLRLPWRPEVPTWTGSTTYYTDKDGLIYKHVETWDKSVFQAFLQTLWPEVADRIWERTVEEDA